MAGTLCVFAIMHIESGIFVLPASLAGGVVGVLAFGNRRPRGKGGNHLRKITVMFTGTVALLAALVLFAKAFGAESGLFAATVTMLVSAWTAMVQTIVPLRLPASMLKVSSAEFAVIRRRGSGVRWFGAVLRHTPLRRLGGAVYLAECANDSARILCGIQEAEAVHVWSMLFCSPWLVFWCLQGLWFSVSSSVAVHAFLNVYPILHLRLARGRMEKCAARFAHRKQRNVGLAP